LEGILVKLDLVVSEKCELPAAFVGIFSKICYAYVDERRQEEAQVSQIEEALGTPSVDCMLVYSEKYNGLGKVLSRRYVNAAEIGNGCLKIGDLSLLPVHLSFLPNGKEHNRILFLAPHSDEAYLAAVLLHRLRGDQVFVHSFAPMNEMDEVKRGYSMLGLGENDYEIGSLEVNHLFAQKHTIEEIVLRLLDEFKPNVVFSVHLDTANFDHIAVAQVVKKAVLSKTGIDLIYGHVIQSRNRKPVVFPIFTKEVAQKIFRAFGSNGFGKVFSKYLAYLKLEMQTFSEPLMRMIGDGRLQNIYSLPIEAERMENYRIPSFLSS
jgi:hypothetical protein